MVVYSQIKQGKNLAKDILKFSVEICITDSEKTMTRAKTQSTPSEQLRSALIFAFRFKNSIYHV